MGRRSSAAWPVAVRKLAETRRRIVQERRRVWKCRRMGSMKAAARMAPRLSGRAVRVIW
jgi:hypothetical protein